ncbi:hypothetical protein WKI71_36275 [Streptomyces sp. MS1.AVA.1]|uniref:Uncharacterized protein n=1 Tax=Streptomyces machairae TaxID=3134109 RepID=A0ABU8USE0_9ACTN
MRRTARALSVAALAGVVLGFVASAAFAEPTAEVSPGSVSRAAASRCRCPATPSAQPLRPPSTPPRRPSKRAQSS